MNEIPKRSQEAVKEDVQRFREWLDKQPHLPHDVEDLLLTAFVCATKTLENAKRKLDNYFSMRSSYPDFFDFEALNKHLSGCRKTGATGQFFLPNKTPDGHRVMFFDANKDFDKTFKHLQDFIRYYMLLELATYLWPEDRNYYMVIDINNFTVNSASKFSPSILAAGVRMMQDSFPLKVKATIYFNAPPFAEFTLNTLIKPLLKEKHAKRIKISTEDMAEFKDIIPLEMLPSNYGGNEKSSAELNEYWLDQLDQNMDLLKQICSQRADENKRPPDSANTYGIEGTFRKLAVD